MSFWRSGATKNPGVAHRFFASLSEESESESVPLKESDKNDRMGYVRCSKIDWTERTLRW